MSAMKRIALGLGIAIAAISVAKQVDVPAGTTTQNVVTDTKPNAEANDAKEIRVVRKQIPFQVEYLLTRTLPHGRTSEQTKGKNGQLVDVYRVEIKEGKEVKTLVRTDRVEPVNNVFLIGKPRFELNRGSYSRTKSITMHASAYEPSAGRGRSATFRTASGMRAQMGVAAVDPRVIKLGTVLYIEGYGLALACDKGSAIKGNRIDLCFPTRSAALKFGRKTVKVHVLS